MAWGQNHLIDRCLVVSSALIFELLIFTVEYTHNGVCAGVVRNTNPRLRIDQAVKFFWGPVTLLAVIAVILAMLGI